MMPELESLGSIPFAIVGVGLLLAAAWSVGGLLVSSTNARTWRASDVALLRITIGLNLVGFLGVLLGLAVLLTGLRSVWFLVCLSLCALPPFWRNLLSRNWRCSLDFIELLKRLPPVTLFAFIVAIMTLGPALCYPTGWDELVYHEVLPRRWQTDGRLMFYSDLPYSAFPSLGEILFWLIAPLENVIAPRLLVWVCWIISLVLIHRLVCRHLSSGAGATLTVAFAASPATLLVSANCYVESILMMNVAAMFFIASVPRRTATRTDRASPILWGVLAGGSAAIKLTGLTILALPFLWYAGSAWHDRLRWKRAVRSWLMSWAVAVVVGSPFYLRPWLETGNPFYPYFSDWFSDDPRRIELSQYHHAIGGSAYGVHSVTTFVAGPLLLAFNEQLYDGSFGWQLLSIVALGVIALARVFRRRARRIVVWPAAVTVVLYVFWSLTAQQARFAVPVVLVCVILASLGLGRLREPLRRGMQMFLIAAAVVSLPWRAAGYYFGSWETVVGLWTWTEYVDDGTDSHYLPLVQAIRDLVPAEAKLLMLFEHRGLYVPRSYVIGTPFFQEAGFSPPERFADPRRVMELLGRGQITHLVMAKSPTGPDRDANWWERSEPLFGGIERCVRQGWLHVVWESESYLILAVRQPPQRSNTIGSIPRNATGVL